jgi:hypothetical protein
MRFSFVLSLAILTTTTGASVAKQYSPESKFTQAMHCIKNGDRDWLSSPLSEERTLQAGFTSDAHSYPGEKHIIVVVYQGQTEGQVFDLKEGVAAGKRLLSVVNNGAFSMARNGKVRFTEPPLGGVWTQEFLKKAITRIAGRERVSIPVQSLIGKFPDVTCSSYAK